MMRKFAAVAAVMVLGAGVAFAASLNVPFFLDNAPVADNAFPPTSGSKSYIALHNNLSVDLEVEVDYYDAGGDGTVNQRTPSPNTFLLPANATYSFRPIGDEPATEAAGSVIPNMPNAALGGSGIMEVAGSAVISWVGGPADIQGRLVTFEPATGAFGYLLPPGF